MRAARTRTEVQSVNSRSYRLVDHDQRRGATGSKVKQTNKQPVLGVKYYDLLTGRALLRAVVDIWFTVEPITLVLYIDAEEPTRNHDDGALHVFDMDAAVRLSAAGGCTEHRA